MDMREQSANGWVHLLTNDHENNRMTASKDSLALFKHNLNKFLCRFMTKDIDSTQLIRDKAGMETVCFPGESALKIDKMELESFLRCIR